MKSSRNLFFVCHQKRRLNGDALLNRYQNRLTYHSTALFHERCILRIIRYVSVVVVVVVVVVVIVAAVVFVFVVVVVVIVVVAKVFICYFYVLR